MWHGCSATISSGPTDHTHDESVKNRVDFWKTKVEETKKEPPQPPQRSPRSNQQVSNEFKATLGTLVARTPSDPTITTEQQTAAPSTENTPQATPATTEAPKSEDSEPKEKPVRSSWRNSRPSGGTFKPVNLESVSADPLSTKEPPRVSPRFLDRKGSVPVMVEQRALHQSMPVPKATNMAGEDTKPAAAPPQAHAKTPNSVPKNNNNKQVRDYDYYLNMAKSMDFTEFQQYRMLYQAGTSLCANHWNTCAAHWNLALDTSFVRAWVQYLVAIFVVLTRATHRCWLQQPSYYCVDWLTSASQEDQSRHVYIVHS